MLFLKYLILFILAGFYPGELNAALQTKEQVDTIKIGLLIPDNKSLAARQGAELAIRIANEKAGTKGKRFSLIVKSMEGPWGTGSKQAVSLIFDDKVCAIMGSHDGRNAHLVEQVCTKARMVFLSAWSGDPTLSKAFVPWFFNCAPNDNQQADAFIEEIYNKRNLGKIVVITDSDYDSESACDSFIKRSLQLGKAEPLKLSFKNDPNDFDGIIDHIKKNGTDGLILFGNTGSSGQLIRKLKTLNIPIPVFGSLSILDEKLFSEKDFENVIFISAGVGAKQETNSFRKEYKMTFGTLPGAVASLSYDGMNLLLQAIRSSGTDRESIQKALFKIKLDGVTGSIKFDEKGNRMGIPSMMQIKNGMAVPVEKY